MPEADNIKVQKSRNTVAKIITAEAVFVITVLITVVIAKYFFKPAFKDFKEWYKDNLTSDTDVNEIISGDKDEI